VAETWTTGQRVHPFVPRPLDGWRYLHVVCVLRVRGVRVVEDKDVLVELHVGVFAARKAAASLRRVHAAYIRHRDAGPQAALGAECIVSGLITAASLPTFLARTRRRHRCRQIIDTATSGVIILRKDCGPESSILVVARRGVTVEISGMPKDADMTLFARAVIGRTPHEVSAAAEATGARASLHRAPIHLGQRARPAGNSRTRVDPVAPAPLP
jgi:hypothetical protein